MAAAMGMAAGGSGSSSSSSSSLMQQQFLKMKRLSNNHVNRIAFVSAASSTSIADPYDTLRVRHGASESDVKKAFRRLALQYHPDVCRGDNCTVKFQQINEAYDILLNNLRDESTEMEGYYDAGIDEPLRGMNDDSEWDLWEEWMGWEGAGIRDYSSHINPYI